MVSNVEIQVDWTVGRCNRLMRPFVTRVSKLRILRQEKQISRRTLKDSNSSSNSIANSRSKREASGEPSPRKGKENDPDWISVPKKRKAKRGYSSRIISAKDSFAEIGIRTPARKNGGGRFQPGELTIPTPYLTRMPSDGDTSLPPNKTELCQYTVATNNGACRAEVMKQRRPKSNKGFYGQPAYTSADSWEDELVLARNVGKFFLDIIYATNVGPDAEEQKKSFPKRGTRSLWATCLRKYGTIIGENEAEQVADLEEESVDATAELYGLAEDLEIPERKRGGRLQLRLIVRAHAVQVMANAIDDGLIPRNAVRLLVSQLLDPPDQAYQASPAEAEVLMSALIAAETPKCVSDCEPAHRNHFYAHAFSNAASQASHLGDTGPAFEFRQFNKVLRSPYIPVEWMATRRVMPLWSNVFRTLLDSSSTGDVNDASELLHQAVFFGTGLEPPLATAEKVLLDIPADYVQQQEACPNCPRAPFGSFLVNPTRKQAVLATDKSLAKKQLANALTNTLSSLSTLLSSFAIAHTLTPADLPTINIHLILSILNTLSLEITMHHASFRNSSTESVQHLSKPSSIVADTKNLQLFARRTVSILTSTLITQIGGCKLPKGLGPVPVNDLIQTMKKLDSSTQNGSANPTSILNCLPELICAIAHGTSQILRANFFDTLSNIIHSLASPNVAGQKILSSSVLFLKQLAFSTAHHFVDESKDPAHYSLISEVEKAMGQTELLDISKTSFRSSTKARTEPRGFKWEEGICEWVLATPKPPRNEESFADLPPEDELDSLPTPPASAPDPPATSSSPLFLPSLPGLSCTINLSSLLFSSPTPPTLSVLQLSKLPTSFGMVQYERQFGELLESQRAQNFDIRTLKLPILKRPMPDPEDFSDDELGLPTNNQHRKRASRQENRPGPPNRTKSHISRRVRNNRDDSEDELSFV